MLRKKFKMMRKLLFNFFSFYSHPEIWKFHGVTTSPWCCLIARWRLMDKDELTMCWPCGRRQAASRRGSEGVQVSPLGPLTYNAIEDQESVPMAGSLGQQGGDMCMGYGPLLGWALGLRTYGLWHTPRAGSANAWCFGFSFYGFSVIYYDFSKVL
jgi:hypothetical protein